MTHERQWITQLQSRWPHVDLRHDTFFDATSRQIVTTDMLVEGVHFSWDYASPADVGWRSMAVSLSDMAATGGTPVWAVVSIGLPQRRTLETLDGIYAGIDACCRQYRCQVVGGDTVRAPQTTLSVTLMGTLAPQRQPGRRHTAQPGDVIAVSGSHGLSRAGLEALRRKLSGFERAKQAHLRPEPQLKLGQQIATVLPHFAMMDSSDGLADAAMRLAEASHADVILDRARLKIDLDVDALAAKANANPLDWVLYGGEDFQLVVSLPPETLGLFPDLQAVGYVSSSQGAQGQGFLKDGGSLVPLEPDKAFQHFEPLSQPPQESLEPFAG